MTNNFPEQIDRYEHLESRKSFHTRRALLYSCIGASAFYLGIHSENTLIGMAGLMGFGVGLFQGVVAIDAKCMQNTEIKYAVDDLIEYVYSQN